MKINYVCPFCFNKHPMSNVMFRCQGRRICDVHAPDVEMSRYMGLDAPIDGPAYFSAGGSRVRKGMPQSAQCPHCHTESFQRVCPDCHNLLPDTIDTDDELIIALIGTRGSGKSNYIGVLIHELRKKIMLGFNGTFRFMTDEDKKTYDENFGSYLYPSSGRRTLISQTQTTFGRKLVAQHRPVLGSIRLEENSSIKKKICAVTLVFFDTAGEDFESSESLDLVSRYLEYSDGIILLVDPLAQPEITQNIDTKIVQHSSSVEIGDVSSPADVLDRVIKIIMNRRGISNNDKISTPLAVAYSKLDAFQSLLPPGCTLSQPSPHVKNGSFILNDAYNVHEEIKALLDAWGSSDLLGGVRSSFTNFNYFSFSALGRPPKSDGTIDKPIPNRIEDALLWILSLNRVIPTSKEK